MAELFTLLWQGFLIPKIHLDVFKREVDISEGLGVLKREKDSPWGSATFIMAKKQGTVRFLTDLEK